MAKFNVTWGPYSMVVDAADAGVAWSEFCGAHASALKHPNGFQRSVDLVDEEPVVPQPSPHVDAVTIAE